MLPLLVFLLPMGLAASVSPVMLSEVLVLLTRPKGRTAAVMYALGTVTVVAVLVAAVIGLGRRLRLPATPHLDAALDVWLGGVLLVGAAALVAWRPRHPRSTMKNRSRFIGPLPAYAFGVVAMATNVTTLALLLPAAKEISASSVPAFEKLVAATVLIALSCLPALGPVALVASAPTASTTDVLTRLQTAIDRCGPTVAVVAMAVAGAFLVLRGVYRLGG